MTLSDLIVFPAVFATLLWLGTRIGRHLERGHTAERLRHQKERHRVKLMQSVGVAHQRGKVEGYELQAWRTARSNSNSR
jgi:hypothetical protein